MAVTEPSESGKPSESSAAMVRVVRGGVGGSGGRGGGWERKADEEGRELSTHDGWPGARKRVDERARQSSAKAEQTSSQGASTPQPRRPPPNSAQAPTTVKLSRARSHLSATSAGASSLDRLGRRDCLDRGALSATATALSHSSLCLRLSHILARRSLPCHRQRTPPHAVSTRFRPS